MPPSRPAIVAATLSTVVGGLGLYLLAWPVPIDPEAWHPRPHDRTSWKPTGDLSQATRVPLPSGYGPEDVDVDVGGNVVVGLSGGPLLLWPATGEPPAVLADTKGRPLGLHRDRHGDLIVADAARGLLRVDPTGEIEVLTTACGGRPLGFADDLEIAADDTIWFTDASEKFGQPEWKLDLLENRPNGRLCVHDPREARTREVLGGLYFANGVAVDPHQQFVLVNETARYRVRKVWIAGPKEGTDEVLIEDLPGFPDGISAGTDGIFWIAIASPRNDLIDAAADKPWLRSMMLRLPDALVPAPEHTARVIGIDAEGAVVHDLFDPYGSQISVVTSVQEQGGMLYLGSLTDDAWAYLRKP